MTKRLIKRAFIAYLLTVGAAYLCFPKTLSDYTNRGLGGAVGIIASPLLLSSVGQSGWQFLSHGVWPLEQERRIVALDDIIKRHGREYFPNPAVSLDLTPWLRPGQESRLLYNLGSESSHVYTTGAFPPTYANRPLFQVGQYFCTSTNSFGSILFLDDKFKCMRLIDAGGGEYILQTVGEPTGRIARLAPRYIAP